MNTRRGSYGARGPASAAQRPGPGVSAEFSFDADAILRGDAEKLVEMASKLADAISTVKTAQIRNFYGPIVRIAESSEGLDWKKRELTLLRPRLHYMAERGKQTNQRELEQLTKTFDRLIRAVKEERHVENLYRFAEAVVAYAKKGDR